MARYEPTFSFMAGTEDITEYVQTFRYSYGLNAFTNPTGRTRIESAGEILLNNASGYWTEDRLNALTTIVAKADAHYMAEAVVHDFRVNPFPRTVSVILRSPQLATLQTPIILASRDIDGLTPAELLTQVGLTVANNSGWTDMRLDFGYQFEGNLQSFIPQFGLWADAHIAENARGHWKAISPGTESRSPMFDITTHDHVILRRTTNSHSRPRWRRDAQRILEYQYREHFWSSIDFGATSVWTRVSSRIRNFYASGLQAENTQLYIEVNAESRYDHRTQRPRNWVGTVWRGQFWSDGLPPAPIIRIGELGNWVFVGIENPPDSAERFRLIFERPDQSVITADLDDLEVYGISRVNIFHQLAGDFEVVPRIIYAEGQTNSMLGFLPDMQFPVPAERHELVENKLTRYAGYIPRVTRLVFHLHGQKSQDRFDEIAGLMPSDVVDLRIVDPTLSVHTRCHAVYFSWQVGQGHRPLLTIDFVSYLDLQIMDDFVLYNDERVTYNSEDVIYA